MATYTWQGQIRWPQKLWSRWHSQKPRHGPAPEGRDRVDNVVRSGQQLSPSPIRMWIQVPSIKFGTVIRCQINFMAVKKQMVPTKFVHQRREQYFCVSTLGYRIVEINDGWAGRAAHWTYSDRRNRQGIVWGATWETFAARNRSRCVSDEEGCYGLMDGNRYTSGELENRASDGDI